MKFLHFIRKLLHSKVSTIRAANNILQYLDDLKDLTFYKALQKAHYFSRVYMNSDKSYLTVFFYDCFSKRKISYLI